MNGQSGGKDYAYLLGVYLGDGCVTKTPDGYWVFRLNTIDMDFAEATSRALQPFAVRRHKVNINTHAVSKSAKPNHSLRFGNQDLCKRLMADTTCKKAIPDYVMGLPRDEKLAFIAGLMDSEGFVARSSLSKNGALQLTNRSFYMGFKSCDPWVPEFIRILESVGVKIGKIGVEQPRKPGYKTPRRFAIKMQSWLDAGCYFNIQRKQHRVVLWGSAGAYEHRSRHPRRSTSATNALNAPRLRRAIPSHRQN